MLRGFALPTRLRAVAEAKAAEIEGLRAEPETERELRRRQELRLAELERRLGMDSTDSGTPSSKERIGAKEADGRGSSLSARAAKPAGGTASRVTRESPGAGP
jgi:hypothetical protein